MTKKSIFKSSMLGLFSTMAATQVQAQTQTETTTGLNNLKIEVIKTDESILRSCYGFPCPDDKTVNTCDDNIIEKNLAQLNELNIISVKSLAAFSCTGYCFSLNGDSETQEQVIQADKCQKAEALAKLVELATPLRVPVKH